LHNGYKTHRIYYEGIEMRTKLSVTIDSEFIKWVDEQVKKRVFRSRSHALEYALSELIERKKKS